MSKYTGLLTPEKFLAKEEEAKLLVDLERWRDDSPRNTAIILLMLKTGARPSEALNLLWRDINFKDQSVYLRTIKLGRDRIVPLGKNLIYRLQKLGPGEPMDRVFKLSYPRLVEIWNEMRPVKKTPHSLRHTFAVNFYKNSDYNLVLTQAVLGHTKLSSTAVYLQIHASLEDLRAAIGE